MISFKKKPALRLLPDLPPPTEPPKPKPPPPPRPPLDPRQIQRMRVRFIFATAICSVTLVLLIFMFSPFFRIQEVTIVGNIRVTNEEINELLRIGASESSHLLLYNTQAAQKRLLENMYISSVEFERILPGQLHVTVQERRLTAFFEHSYGSFLYLDDYGRVLDVRTYFTEALPVLVGLRFTRFQVGEVLEVPDPSAFNVVVQYAQLLNQHDIIDRVSYINVNDPTNIRIIISNKEFNVGGVSNADEKIRTISAVLDTMPNADLIPGYMDLREIRREYFFEISP